MIKKLIALSLFVLLVLTPAAYAQAPLTLPAMEIDLWPEYDDSGVLVIYKVTLPSGISLPAEFTLRIPAAAGAPNAVAASQPDGSLMNASYKQTTKGAWNELTITATSPVIQVEYYDPGLKKDGRSRNYAFEWPGDYAVQSLTMQVQQPRDASEMKISPDDFGPGQQGTDSLTYFTENIGSIPAGQSFKVQLAYNKASDVPSLTQLQPTVVGGIEPSSSSISSIFPWLLGAAGVILIVGGVIWFNASRSKGSQKKSVNRSRHKPTNQKSSAIPSAEGYVYCSQCGKRASSGDRFCRTCGAELRK